MDDISILEAVERYINGEMTTDERVYFEQLRKSNPDIDQLVVEHTLFLQQMNKFGELKKFKSLLNDTHVNLAEEGKIKSAKLKGQGKVVYLWNRYKRVAAIAASIAGVTALTISALVWSVSPSTPTLQIEQMSRKLSQLETKLETNRREQTNEINKVRSQNQNQAIFRGPYKTGGTGFLIDGKGYLVTNAHVVQNATNIAVQNNKGVDFNVRVVFVNPEKDLAILKIEDDNFKAYTSIPYTIKRSSTELGEPIYTLGYPRNEIVYVEGYLSAKTGFNGDTLSFQIAIPANPGNSGGPLLNKNGEVVGVLSARQTTAEGVVFATQSKYIYQALDELKKDTTFQSIKLPAVTTIKGMDRVQQVKKVEDCIFMVKVN